MRHIRHTAWQLATLTWCCLLSSCNFLGIDDDLSDCSAQYALLYQAHLSITLSTQITDALYTADDLPVAAALQDALSDVFTDHAHDLDLLFFTTDSLLETHEQHAMEASERTYNIELPIKEYAHVALANVARVPQMSIANDDRASQVMLRQQRQDTVDSHPSGIYTARRTITLEQDKSQMIKVDLYMANAAVALILDSVDAGVVDTRVYLHGMADGMMLRDSSYVTDSDPYIRTHKLTFGTRAAAAYRLCHYGVCFPSAGSTAGTPCWSIEVYATLSDGTVTRSVMQINSPLQAGQLEVVRCTLNAQGIIQTAMTEASITVSLDWKSGSSYTPTM